MFGHYFQIHKTEGISYYDQKKYAKLKTLELDFLSISKYEAHLNTRHAGIFPNEEIKKVFQAYFNKSTIRANYIAK